MPEAHWDAQGGKVKDESAFAKYISDHVAFKAAEDSRRLTLPQKAEDLKLELSKGFKAPQGIEFKPNENDPLLPQARAFALKHGLSQEGFSELLDLHAAGQIGNQQSIANAKAAEVAKLGAAGQARMDAATTWLKAQLGDELGKHFTSFLYTAQQVEGIEKLMASFRSQGGASYSPQHREADTPKMSDAEYEKLSYSAKKEYTAKFAQQQSAA